MKKEKVLPGVMLVDIMMPSSQKADIQLIQKIKPHLDWKQIPVLMLSARSESEVILEALRQGALELLH